ncbi:MAG TPA: T9SS type A sorting domain-containing protein [Bacteroidales bacterium]|nr:T9SS type A sorting domain-containing protein [Bacteroidales bacterium]
MYGAWQLRKVYGRPMTDLPGKGFQAEETDIAGGYLQEWKLSWDTLASPSYGAYWGGKKFRFEILNQDNDGAGLNSQLFWNSNAYDQWNTIKNQGTVYLDYSPSDDLVLSTSSFNISAFFKIFSVEVYTADAWSAQSNKSWLTLENTSGEGNGTIKFSVSSNNSELSREAKITVSNGKVSKVVIVTQAGVSCSSLLAKTKLELQEARDSINMLLDKVARYDSITVAVVEMKDFTAIVKLPETNVSLKLYPNPTKDKVLVECESLISKIEIFNIKGQKVYDKISSANTSYLRLEGFKAGTYILKVHTDKGVVGGIFVIKR